MTWIKTHLPEPDKHTTYISSYRNGDMRAILSLDHGINDNSLFPELADNYNVHTRTRYIKDTFVQMSNAPKGSLKIGSRNFKTLKGAKKYLNKWMSVNP